MDQQQEYESITQVFKVEKWKAKAQQLGLMKITRKGFYRNISR